MKKRFFFRCAITALCALFLMPASAFGDSSGREDDQPLSPYFFVEGEGDLADHFPLKSTHVSTTVNGTIAETYLTQTYANEGEKPINASYVFPASTKVSVHGMTMEINDQVITAQIKEKEEAKEEFEEAKEEGKSASLLEQQRPNVFSMDVANIMPGDTVRIQLHYTELITSTEGTYQFVFPTVAGPRYISASSQKEQEEGQWAAAPYLMEGNTPPGTYQIEVNLSAGLPISQISSRSHQISVSQDDPGFAKVTLSNPEDYAGDRDFILDYQLTGEQISSGLILDSGEEENFFMLMVQPPKRFRPEDIPPREYIFVLDVSGSMDGYPLDTAKGLIENLVTHLNETDQFNLVLFSDETAVMSGTSVAATQGNVSKALKFIDDLEGGGGTEMAPAIKQALNMPENPDMSRSIITVTDGYLTGEKEIFNLIRDHLNSTNFFSFGIGTSVNRYLIEGIAKSGAGEAFIVTDEKDAEETADRFRSYIQTPILTDVRISYDGFDVYDAQPQAVPTLFAQKPIVVFGKWRGEPSGTIRITGKTGSQDYSQEISVSDAASSQDNPAIRYLWARTRVEQLTDYGTYEELEDSVKREVTDIGLTYSMLTPYTSFIAVTDTIRNESGESTDVDQPLPLPSHVSNLAVGGYTMGAEPGDYLFLLGGIAVAAYFLLRRRKRGVR